MFYEEFIVGSEQELSGRTVTDADVVIFAGLTGGAGASNPLFLDEDDAKKTSFGHRIVLIFLRFPLRLASPIGSQLVPLARDWSSRLGMSFKMDETC